MSELRLNPLAGRWVTVSTSRAFRPAAFDHRTLAVEPDPRPCPFCPQADVDAAPTLELPGPNGQWAVRVVPNRYPAFDGNDPLHVEHLGPVYTHARASGTHEVLVLSPDHDASWADLDDHHLDQVMAVLRDRFEHQSHNSGIRYTQAIVNHGREAGASMLHPHGQLLGMPFVPKDLTEEEAGFARFEGGCLLCTTLEAEIEVGYRTVLEDDGAVVVCPYWSGTPFEMLVIPRSHEGHLHEAKPTDLSSVGRSIGVVLRRLRAVLGEIAYNLVFHASPHQHDNEFHWHVHVLPKVTTRAGFELGTGVLINIVTPEQAAEELNRTA
jgi:UDPglucose--hexose-1-phosphate uridylyltransferase